VNCFEESATAQEARAAIARSYAIAHRILAAPEFSAEMGPDYVASEHLALGSDFDGATLVPADASATPWYLEGIATHEGSDGPVFNKSDIENIAGESLFRLLENALSAGRPSANPSLTTIRPRKAALTAERTSPSSNEF